uniref:Uncharacterized protein n=1 Tax=Anguilla anguilla TaxID=7936 RepID=A0A0E9SM13_ANGAN
MFQLGLGSENRSKLPYPPPLSCIRRVTSCYRKHQWYTELHEDEV